MINQIISKYFELLSFLVRQIQKHVLSGPEVVEESDFQDSKCILKRQSAPWLALFDWNFLGILSLEKTAGRN